MLDISGPQSSTIVGQNNYNNVGQGNNSASNLDLLGGADNKEQFKSNIQDIFSIDLGLGQPQQPQQLTGQNLYSSNNMYQQPQVQQQPIYGQPQQLNYQTSYQQPNYMINNLA